MDRYSAAVILLVEDDLGDQKLIKKSLSNEKLANQLKIVACGEDALEYLEKSKKGQQDCPMPELILLDLNMPGMGGKAFLKKIKEDPCLNIIPVVVLTTSDSDKDILESFQLQAAGYVKKPVTLEGFHGVISNLTDYWFFICKHVQHDKEHDHDNNFCVIN